MKQVKIPEALAERTNTVLDELERQIFADKREPRPLPKSGLRAGDLRPMYGTP